nr:hypothetical protein Iba_chr07eCG0910 [Ipomoea batatas]
MTCKQRCSEYGGNLLEGRDSMSSTASCRDETRGKSPNHKHSLRLVANKIWLAKPPLSKQQIEDTSVQRALSRNRNPRIATEDAGRDLKNSTGGISEATSITPNSLRAFNQQDSSKKNQKGGKETETKTKNKEETKAQIRETKQRSNIKNRTGREVIEHGQCQQDQRKRNSSKPTKDRNKGKAQTRQRKAKQTGSQQSRKHTKATTEHNRDKKKQRRNRHHGTSNQQKKRNQAKKGKKTKNQKVKTAEDKESQKQTQQQQANRQQKTQR